MASVPQKFPMADSPQETSTTNAPQNTQQEKLTKIAIIDIDNCAFDIQANDIAEGIKKVLYEGGYTHYVICTARSTFNLFQPHANQLSWLHAQVKISQSLEFTIENIQKRMTALFPHCKSLGISTADDFHPLEDGSILGFGQGYARVMQQCEQELQITTPFDDKDEKEPQIEANISDLATNKSTVLLLNFSVLHEKWVLRDINIPNRNNLSRWVVNYYDLVINRTEHEFQRYYFGTKNIQLSMIAAMLEETFPGQEILVDFYDDDLEKNLYPAINALNLDTISPQKVIKEFNCWYFHAFESAITKQAPERKGAITTNTTQASYTLQEAKHLEGYFYFIKTAATQKSAEALLSSSQEISKVSLATNPNGTFSIQPAASQTDTNDPDGLDPNHPDGCRIM